jgi:hypothetical protein
MKIFRGGISARPQMRGFLACCGVFGEEMRKQALAGTKPTAIN